MAHRDKFGRPTFGRKWVRRPEGVVAPNVLPIKFPVVVRREEDAYIIEDGLGRAVTYTYFDEDEARRAESGDYTEAEARRIAEELARLLAEPVALER